MGDKETLEPGYKVIRIQGPKLTEHYFNLIIAKWMRSYRYSNEYMKLTDSKSYFKAYQAYITKLLPKTIVRLAVLWDDADVVLGFSVISDTLLHYVYVGKDFRNNGIGKTLVPIQITEFTHLTKAGLALWPQKAPDAKFNPFQ